MAYDPLILPAGHLRHSITISSPSPAGDAFGASGNTWIPILTTRASLRQITAKTMYQTGAISTQATHSLRMRYRSDIAIAAGYQVAYSTHTYRVVSVDNVLERSRVYELLLLEIGGQ
jgi:SPP1 family predicted phage head-tail adaptor